MEKLIIMPVSKRLEESEDLSYKKKFLAFQFNFRTQERRRWNF